MEKKARNLSKIVLSSALISNVLAGASVYAADENVTPLAQPKDLNNASDWSKNAIQSLLTKGVLEGDLEGNVNPSGKLTRLQTVAILGRALGIKTDAPTGSSFKDVSADSWGLPYLESLHKVGIIEGNGDGSFRPNDTITREEIAVLFVRIAGISIEGKGGNLQVKDASDISDWAKPYVQAALEAGILTVDSSGAFGGKTEVTREAMAVVTEQVISSEKFEQQKETIKTLFEEGKKVSNSDPSL